MPSPVPPGRAVNGVRYGFGYGTCTKPGISARYPYERSPVSAPTAPAVPASPWYPPMNPITIWRPVARRMNRTAVSTASVPFSAMSTLVRFAGATARSRSASGSTYSCV